MILGTLGATLLRNLLIGRVTIIAGEETIRSGENFYVVPSFIQFWNTKDLQKNAKFYVVYSRNNLPKVKGGAYIINLDEYESIGIHWIALYVNYNNVTYFDSFRVEHITKEIIKFIGNKNITTSNYRIQAYD